MTGKWVSVKAELPEEVYAYGRESESVRAILEHGEETKAYVVRTIEGPAWVSEGFNNVQVLFWFKEEREKKYGVSDSTKRERMRWVGAIDQAVRHGSIPEHFRRALATVKEGILRSIEHGGSGHLRQRIQDLEAELATLRGRESYVAVGKADFLPGTRAFTSSVFMIEKVPVGITLYIEKKHA